MLEALAAVIVPSFLNAGFSPAMLLVLVDLHLAGLAGQRHRRHLPGKAAVGVGADRTLGRGDRELVLRLARKAVLGHALLGEHAHRLAALVSVFQAVERHVVEGREGTVFPALARPDQQMRRVGHAFHAAGDNHTGTAGNQHVVAEHHRAHARAAHLGQGHRADRLRQPGGKRGLPRRRLALARHQAAAEQHLVNSVTLDRSTLDRSPDRHGTELPRLLRRKIAEQAADRRASSRGDDNRIVHGVLSSFHPGRPGAIQRAIARITSASMPLKPWCANASQAGPSLRPPRKVRVSLRGAASLRLTWRRSR